MTRQLFAVLLLLAIAGPAVAQDRPKVGETITTESGLVYKFTQLGKGPQPQTGDLMVIHGIGTLTDGKEFWNTRTDGAPYEYTLGVDSVIKGFSEGMRHVREGDRIIITMTPELGYGARERTGIPANSTLIFDYEILAVKPLSFAKLMREAIAAGTVDEAIAKAKATPNLKEYYVSVPSIQAAANVANRKEVGSGDKVIALGLTLLPEAYQLHQILGRLQTLRDDKPAAIKSYETALKLNPKKTAAEIRDFETTTTALAAIRAVQDMPADYRAVLTALGKTGDFKDGVLKVNIPRNDVRVTIAQRPAPTPFGFGGWIAMTKGDGGSEVLMGDLVLQEDEVNPIMSAVLANGLDVTAVHNHFFWDQPRMFYMHVHGMGSAADLARRIKPAIDLIDEAARRAGPPPAAATTTATSQLDGAALSKTIGYPGDQNGAVYKITIGRPDINVREHGAVINARMGLNTWAAFTGTDADAMVAGDIAMLASEVTPVLKALRDNGLSIVAIHHHMTGTNPVVYFLHYYGTGNAAKLAQGVRAAVDLLGKPTAR